VRMKVVIVGAGSVGTYIGGSLLANGVDVYFVSRPTLKQNAEEKGLVLSNFLEPGKEVKISASSLKHRFVLDMSDQLFTDVDYILVTVKNGATEDIARELGTLDLDPKTVIVSFQNGVANKDILSQHIPSNTVLSGIVGFNVVWSSDIRFHKGTSNPLTIEQHSSAIEVPLANALRKAGFEVEIEKDIIGVQWTKLLLNLNNAINALSGITLKQQISTENFRLLLSRQMTEALKVLEAAKIKPKPLTVIVRPYLLPKVILLPNYLYFIIAKSALTIDDKAASSMQDDLMKGRKTEIDTLQGAISELGKKHNVATPIIDKIIQLIRDAEESGSGTPNLSSEEMCKLVGIETYKPPLLLRPYFALFLLLCVFFLFFIF